MTLFSLILPKADRVHWADLGETSSVGDLPQVLRTPEFLAQICPRPFSGPVLKASPGPSLEGTSVHFQGDKEVEVVSNEHEGGKKRSGWVDAHRLSQNSCLTHETVNLGSFSQERFS